MFSSFSNMLPNLALPGGSGPDAAKDNQATPTPTSINPFDRLLAVKRRFVPTSSPTAMSETPVTAEPESGATTPAADTDAEHEASAAASAAAAARKKKPLNETFVVVRPPPSVSNHPLNLQLQLIPPKAEPQHQPRSASTSTTGSTSSAGGGYSGAGGVPNVPPVSAGLQSRKETARQAGGVPESPAEDNELTRVRTNRSDLSQFYSSIGSSASVQSFSTVASTSTSAGGSSRRIIPLYNLSAHNVLQNTVQDAGTDATVSRFRKRGIDVVGLGVLEPVEVWGNAPLGGPGGYGPVDESASDAGHGTAPSADDHSATHNYSPPKQIVQLHSREVSDSAPVTPKESGTKKLFGKLFKKKDTTAGGSGSAAASPAGTPTTMLSPPTPARTSFGRDRPASLYSNGGPAGVPSTPATPVTPTVSTSLAPPSSSAGTYLQAPVLGTQATLRSDIYPPTGRASAYVWVLRRWTKGGGMFAGLAGAVGASGGGLDMSRAGVEVRFEWVRGRKRRRAGRGEASESGGAAAADPSRTVGTGRRIRGGGSSRPVSVVDRPVSVLSVGGGDGLDFSTVASESLSVPGPLSGRAPSVIASERSVSPDARRRSVDSSHTRSRRGSKRSMSPMKKGAMARNDSGSSREREECEEDSDPEDSETPWSCTLRVLPLELPPPPSSDDLTNPTAPVDPSLPTGLKLRLAHLVPAPHHPKVIGQFKMPFPLPDVSVSRMELVPRAPGDMFGLGGGGEGGGRVGVGRGEMVMTAEEIKDVVSTTGLWLMVREGFGGLGGKKRKGDGWKIRS
ncbi:hypothetical protein FRC09_008150 [Ceratobasidium sp. 395]|nr:hypothetical protein FRC09_008150 [Ceratobasidium sp. 395]